jgi:uncharacterized protein involved in response to NO
MASRSGSLPPAGVGVAPPAARPSLDPYRILFPLGVLYAILAALVWPLYAAGWVTYPAMLHWTLMVQGFLHCFVLGFLMTAMPAFLHAEKARPWELGLAAGAMVLFGAFAFAGAWAAAQAAYLVTLVVVVQAGVRRLPRRRGDPAEEFLFVVLGFAFAAVGAVMGAGVGAGWWDEPTPRFALHLFTRGMMLSIVLGLGGLLVPTFSAMREPLVIPGVARPGQRGPRRALYVPLALLLVVAMVVEATGRPGAAAWLRVVPATVLGLLVWKLFRLPGRRDTLSWSIWSAGWFVLLGLWTAAVVPARAILGYHIVFLGGFGLLILGIATRVVVTHGAHPVEQEGRVLRRGVVVTVALALLTRVGAEFAPATVNLHYALSGLLWIVAWLVWGSGALPRIAKPGIRRTAQPGVGPRIELRSEQAKRALSGEGGTG